MNPERKDNSWQGYHGVGKHDQGGKFGNYSNYQDKKGRNYKKIIIIIVAILVILLGISLFNGSQGPNLSQAQVDVETIAKSQSTITLFIDEYEANLTEDNTKGLSAHVYAINNTNTKLVKDYYNDIFATKRALAGSIPKSVQETMTDSIDIGNYDDIYAEELIALVEDNKIKMQNLYTTTTGTNLKSVLETSYDNFELVDQLN